jgi:predicted DNA-binding protein YlxM (UPF0122 family)
MEYFSIKEIADSLGVSKQKVYRCIKSNQINEAIIETVKGNNVLKYDKQAVERIKQLLGGSTANDNNASNASNEAHNDTSIEALLKQLEIKDKQIEALNERLAEANKILEQQQKLNALDKQKILLLESKQEVIHADREPKGFFSRLFRR